MMLVDGFRWFVGLGCRVMCVAVGWRLWRSLMVEGMLLSLVADDGLFKLALWRSVVVDGRVFVGVGWHGWVSFVVVGLLFGMELLVRVLPEGGSWMGR